MCYGRVNCIKQRPKTDLVPPTVDLFPNDYIFLGAYIHITSTTIKNELNHGHLIEMLGGISLFDSKITKLRDMRFYCIFFSE